MMMIKKFGILGALLELLEPHLFGKTGALKFGAIGVHAQKDHFQKRFNIYCTEMTATTTI